MSDIQSEKLEYFEREIMNRVQAESEAIRAETQRMKDEANRKRRAFMTNCITISRHRSRRFERTLPARSPMKRSR